MRKATERGAIRKGGETDEGREDEMDEAILPRAEKNPTKPLPEEVAQKGLIHLPFRSWRPCCVRGRAKNKPRKRGATNRARPRS